MTNEEVDSIIAGFHAGGGIVFSDYHAGEMNTWSYDHGLDRFLTKTRSLSDRNRTVEHTESEMRDFLSQCRFSDWSTVTEALTRGQNNT